MRRGDSYSLCFSFTFLFIFPVLYTIIPQNLLEERVGELVASLGRDCANTAAAVTGGGDGGALNEVWQLSSLSALSTVLSALGGGGSSNRGSTRGFTSSFSSSSTSSSALGSHAFVQALQVLMQQGHLQAILAVIGTSNTYMPMFPSNIPLAAPVIAATLAGVSGNTSAGGGSNTSEALFISTLSLCVHIAGSIEGAEALIQCNFLQRINSLLCFRSPPPFPDEIAYFGQDAQQSREEALAQLQNKFSVTTNLLRCLFAAMPASHALALGAADFLRSNHIYVTQLLRMRYLSLDGLALTESVVSLLAMVAAVPRSPLQQVHGNGNGGNGDLAALLGNCTDSFLSDISMLLGVLGKF